MTTAEAPTITFARMMEVAAAVSGLDMASLYVKGDDLEQYAKRHFIYLLCTGTPLCKPTRGEIMRTLGMTNYAMFRVTLSKIKHRAAAGEPDQAASVDTGSAGPRTETAARTPTAAASAAERDRNEGRMN